MRHVDIDFARLLGFRLLTQPDSSASGEHPRFRSAKIGSKDGVKPNLKGAAIGAKPGAKPTILSAKIGTKPV